MLDLIIRGGQVVDGTGAPRQQGDVGIRDGRIVAIGTVDESTKEVIDADGKIVSPGFIDLHTHFDAQVFWDPALRPSSLHGFTTAIGGNCGFSIAPVEPGDVDYLLRMLARVEGMPVEALQANLPWNWKTTGDYLDALEGRPAINVGFMVGHSALRRAVLGEEATERGATSDEIEDMRRLLREGIAAGGLGFSSSHGSAHFDHLGQPVPSRHADAMELLALAAVCSELPGTSLAFIGAATTSDTMSDEEVELMSRMSVAAQRPLNWNVLGVRDANGLEASQKKLRAGDRARELGGRVVALSMPGGGSVFYTFSGMTFDAIPGWAPVMKLPIAERLAALSDPAERRRLDELVQAAGNFGQVMCAWGTRRIQETHAPENKQYEGRIVADIAAEQGKDAFDALLDIACADGLQTVFTSVAPTQTDADWVARASLLRDRRTVMGGSDAGAHLDFVGAFNYSTAFLAEMRARGIMTTEEAVHMMTAEPAALYGLKGRGTLAIGNVADIVIFDEATVASQPIVSRRDIPACDGPRLYAEALGIDRVLVSGIEIVRDGDVTDALPGKVLRSGIDTETAPLQ